VKLKKNYQIYKYTTLESKRYAITPPHPPQ